jgi:putative transposase
MSRTLSRTILHITFATQDRAKTIPAVVLPRLFSYLAGICRKLGSHAFRIGGVSDHVHVACTLPRTVTIAKLVNTLKSNSSAWIKSEPGGYREFAWQSGYGVFSVSNAGLQALVAYIDRQAEHHREVSCKEELVRFLDDNDLKYDARYLR